MNANDDKNKYTEEEEKETGKFFTARFNDIDENEPSADRGPDMYQLKAIQAENVEPAQILADAMFHGSN